MSDESLAVRVRGLVKSYGAVHAVRGIDLDIRQGEIFALLGPNGAGKTTTVEILEGYRRRDQGEVRVFGYDPARERAKMLPRVGIVLQKTGVDRYLTVAETVRMYASYYPKPRDPAEIVDLVGLTEKRNSRLTTLSGGQLRRLDVAVALAGDPDLLFLDEPTTGFDPSARREAWEVVKNLASLGKTVLLTTHYMDEAQYLADRAAVISAGRIVAEGSPATLRAGHAGRLHRHCVQLDRRPRRRRVGRRRHAPRHPLLQLGTAPGLGPLAVAETVEEAAEDAALAGEGGRGRGSDGALPGDRLVVVGPGDGVDHLSLVEVLGALDQRYEPDKHPIDHDLGLKPRRPVGVPLGLAPAGQRHAHAELHGPSVQVGVNTAVPKGVNHPPCPELIHSVKVTQVPENSLNTSSTPGLCNRRLGHYGRRTPSFPR